MQQTHFFYLLTTLAQLLTDSATERYRWCRNKAPPLDFPSQIWTSFILHSRTFKQLKNQIKKTDSTYQLSTLALWKRGAGLRPFDGVDGGRGDKNEDDDEDDEVCLLLVDESDVLLLLLRMSSSEKSYTIHEKTNMYTMMHAYICLCRYVVMMYTLIIILKSIFIWN